MKRLPHRHPISIRAALGPRSTMHCRSSVFPSGVVVQTTSGIAPSRMHEMGCHIIPHLAALHVGLSFAHTQLLCKHFQLRSVRRGVPCNEIFGFRLRHDTGGRICAARAFSYSRVVYLPDWVCRFHELAPYLFAAYLGCSRHSATIGTASIVCSKVFVQRNDWEVVEVLHTTPHRMRPSMPASPVAHAHHER